jgi:hypothetical protein
MTIGLAVAGPLPCSQSCTVTSMVSRRAGRAVSELERGPGGMMNNPAEGSTVPVIRAGTQYAFLLRFDIEKNPDARLGARFTDDAGLYRQIDQDLHLQHLGNRDDWVTEDPRMPLPPRCWPCSRSSRPCSRSSPSRKQAKEVGDTAEMLRIHSDRLTDQRKVNEKQTEVLELQARELRESLDERIREAELRHRAQASRVFVGVMPDQPGLVAPFAENASEFPICSAQFWFSGPEGLSGPDDLGVIMPRRQATVTPKLSADEALARIILTFRDADDIPWVRMADGTLKEQTGNTVRESVLAALADTTDGQPGT